MFETNKQCRIAHVLVNLLMQSVKDLTHEGQATAHIFLFRGIKNIRSDGEVRS